MYARNLLAEMAPPTGLLRGGMPKQARPADWLSLYNQHYQLGTWEMQVDTRQVDWSPEAYRIHGLEPDQQPLFFQKVLSLFEPQDAVSFEKLVNQAVLTRRGFHYRLRLQHPDGPLRLIEGIAEVGLDGEGAVVRLAGIVRDVTAEVEQENTRIGQTSLLLRMVRSMPSGAALLDREMRYIAWSRRWLTDMGLPADTNLINRSHYELFPRVGPSEQVVANIVMKGQAMGMDRETVPCADGAVAILDWVVQPWQDRFGETGGVVILTHVHYRGASRSDSGPRPAPHPLEAAPEPVAAVA